MSWRILDADFPEAWEEDFRVTLAGESWELRRVGKTSFLRIPGCESVLELPGLAKFGGLFPEPELASRGTRFLLASSPSYYIAVGRAPLGIDDVTCGTYAVTWFDLDAGSMFDDGERVLDGGEEVLHPPNGAGHHVALFLRRTTL